LKDGILSVGMRIVKQIVLTFILITSRIGSSSAQTTPQTKQIVKAGKVKLKPSPKPIQSKDIRKAETKLVLSANEKAIQKANQKRIQDEREAFRKSNKKAAKQFKAMQKAYKKKLRDEQQAVKKST